MARERGLGRVQGEALAREPVRSEGVSLDWSLVLRRQEEAVEWLDRIDWTLPGRGGNPEHFMRRALVISMAALYGQILRGDIENSDLGAYVRETQENEEVFSCGPVAVAWHIYKLATGPHEPDPEILTGFKRLIREPPDDLTREMIRLSWFDTLVTTEELK